MGNCSCTKNTSEYNKEIILYENKDQAMTKDCQMEGSGEETSSKVKKNVGKREAILEMSLCELVKVYPDIVKFTLCLQRKYREYTTQKKLIEIKKDNEKLETKTSSINIKFSKVNVNNRYAEEINRREIIEEYIRERNNNLDITNLNEITLGSYRYNDTTFLQNYDKDNDLTVSHSERITTMLDITCNNYEILGERNQTDFTNSIRKKSFDDDQVNLQESKDDMKKTVKDYLKYNNKKNFQLFSMLIKKDLHEKHKILKKFIQKWISKTNLLNTNLYNSNILNNSITSLPTPKKNNNLNNLFSNLALESVKRSKIKTIFKINKQIQKKCLLHNLYRWLKKAIAIKEKKDKEIMIRDNMFYRIYMKLISNHEFTVLKTKFKTWRNLNDKKNIKNDLIYTIALMKVK